MIRTILVAASGSESDTPVFETALAAAQPLAAHLDFLHIVPTIGDAALNMPHADYAIGQGLIATLEDVEMKMTRRSRAAERHFRQFCERHALPMVAPTSTTERLTACWKDVTGDALECLTFHARHHDLVVMGRRTGPDGLPSGLLELALVRCGRPILVAPATGSGLRGPAVIGWKESPEAARALAGALPLLKEAGSVTLVGVEEHLGASDAEKEGLDAAARQLAWHGIRAEPCFVGGGRRRPADVLASVVAERQATLLVMGAYGHSRMREIIFGGCTQIFLREAPVAVLFAA